MPDGFVPTRARVPALASVAEALARGDLGPAHGVFHASRDGAWGLRLAIVRLVDEHVTSGRRIDELARDGDACWLATSAYRHARERNLREALADCELAVERDDRDPTPFVIEIFAARGMRDRRKAFERATEAYIAAQARAPELYEAHEQMLHVLSICDESAERSADSMFQLARSIAGSVPEGVDVAFVPALAHFVQYVRAVDERRARPQLVANQQAAYEIAAACRRSFGSPRYVPTHRTFTLLHVAAALHAVIGDATRLRAELERAGDTYDADVWNAISGGDGVDAFVAARAQAGL